jgi:multidrug resistance efflux pump
MQNKENKNNTRNKIIIVSTILLVAVTAISGLTYWKITSARVYVEDASISAPVISLYPKVDGTLQETYVNAGDSVEINAPIARVGSELIKAKSAGLVLSVNTNVGGTFGPTTAIATMINPSELKVVGKTQEDKGLKYIKVGQQAIFTVDAFGSKKYSGIVEEISPTAAEGDVVFNISGTRQESDFNVKVRFDIIQYSELKNGMSAKLWIYK